jgi:hypothetical protein
MELYGHADASCGCRARKLGQLERRDVTYNSCRKTATKRGRDLGLVHLARVWAISCSRTVVLMPLRGILMRSRLALATLLMADFDIAATFGG